MKKITLADLRIKTWYRALKMFYFLFFILTLIMANFIALIIGDANENFIISFFICNFIALVLLELIRRAFYYFILGEFHPTKSKLS